MDKKLGVIVPYRDRYEHLIIFKKSIRDYLNSKNKKFELIIVEQDDAKNFNRGKLLNIGFLKAKQLKCDYVVFHDVDMLPVDVDYSYNEYPIHLSTNFISEDENFKREIFDEYFGGVTIFPMDDFEKINGFSNEYYGWGFEDTDLLHRCRKNNVPLDTKEFIQNGTSSSALRFNGYDSYVTFDNDIFIKNSGKITIFVSFKPNDLTLNFEKYDDEFCIFSNEFLKIKYNSYQKYIVDIKNEENDYSYVSSLIKPAYKTNITVVIDFINSTLKMYQDGFELGITKIKQKFTDSKFYLGCDFKKENLFNGLIDSFAVFDSELDDREIDEISENEYYGLTTSFGKYKSNKSLKVYCDSKFIIDNKFINIVDPSNFGYINNCKVVPFNFDKIKTLEIPFRRNCTFKLLPHQENGYVNGSWRHITTRYNQLKYHNEAVKTSRNRNNDGLNTCKFKLHNSERIDNETYLIVGI